MSVNKALIDYNGVASGDASFIASHFSLLDADLSEIASVLQSIKTANPNMRIFGYRDLIAMHTSYDDWAEVNSHEDWFIHTASGSRITNTQYGWTLMDPASSGWRQHYVSYVNSKFSAGPSYNGVFADDVWNQISDYQGGLSGTVPASKVASWHSDVIGMLQYTKTNLASGKLLFINSDEGYTNDYINVADGEMLEGSIHAEWSSIDSFWSSYWYMELVNILVSKSVTNKMVWMASGTVYSSDVTKMAAMVKFCYTAFLLGMSGTQPYFGFNSWGNSDGAKGYYSIMDTNIGQPTGAYYSSQNVYMRDFTLGKALFNPSGNSYTVTLGGNYKLLNGTVVSSVTLGAYSGEVLLLSTPPPTQYRLTVASNPSNIPFNIIKM